jgi:ribosome-associated toxin RatA of RatAB toxin-antitoxin module
VKSSIGVDVAAPGELVFRLARDVERWPTLLPHYVRVDADPRGRSADASLVARMVARRPLVPILGLGLPVAWRSRTWSEESPRRLRFVHVGGATNGMDVTWRFEPTPFGCRVSIEHDFRPRLPLWAPFIDRFFTRPIASRTLATFKSIAEALAAAPIAGSEPAAADASEPALATNHPT